MFVTLSEHSFQMLRGGSCHARYFYPKLPQLLKLKYYAVRDAVTELGSVANISEVFIGFQQYLYSQDVAA